MNEQYERIMELCNEHYITLYKMCKDINLSQGAMTDLKKGRKQNLSVSNLAKIAKYFNVSVDYLSGADQRDEYEPPLATRAGGLTLNVMADDMGDFAEVWNVIKDRPEARMLFKSANTATPEQLVETAKYLEFLKSSGKGG